MISHASIARLALERGFLDRGGFERALEAIEHQRPGLQPAECDAFWVGGERLKREQLDTILGRKETRIHRTRAGVGPTPRKSHERAEAPVAEAPPRTQPSLVPYIPRYEIGALVGTGGMGDVYEARDTHLGRRIALKVPRRDVEGAVSRVLAREARVAGALEHPAIVPVYDAGEEPGVGPYYAMRLLEQPTLGDVIERLADEDPAAQRDYTLGRLLRYFVQICRAVDYAHSRGVVHCDLKPANVVVGEFGEVVILDWGMAFRLDEAVRERGGTPGYMAPEQGVPDALVDARADVFALGSILYEILCHEPAYDDHATDLIIRHAAGEQPFPPPPPPRSRLPAVAEELEQVCLQAMSVEPAQRQATAGKLADDIEAFLEGTKERERRAARAVELIEQGEQLADMYREYDESRPRLVEEIAHLHSGVAEWDPPERKRELWDAEDRLSATDSVGVRTFQAAIAAYEQALDEVPGHAVARRGLAALYTLEARRARARRDDRNRIYFEELVKQYTDGAPALVTRHQGLLRVTATGAISVAVSDYEEQDRRLIPVRTRPAGAAPCELALSGGSYLLTLTTAGGATLSCPVRVDSDRDLELRLDTGVIDELSPGERYIPAGAALLGGDDLSPWGREVRPVEIDAFVLAERPVTFADYLAFLEERLRGGEDMDPFMPLNAQGIAHWKWVGDQFVLAGNFAMSPDELRGLPAVGVSREAAEAYAAWRLLKTGRTYRLPRESEWEKAARGVDGRAYPWGDHFDASFCKMVQSRPGAPRPEHAGAFAADVSPYGVRDLAGGVADWVIADDPHAIGDITRGGAWCDWRADCHLASRRPYQPGAKTSRVGFRLARDP